MPTTTNFGWTYPANTDLVMNGASAMGTIATSIDTTLYARSRRVGGRWTGATGLVTGGYTVTTWNAESYDTDGFLTPSSSTITIPAGLDGLYIATYRVNTALTGAVTLSMSISWTTAAYGTTRDNTNFVGSTAAQLGGTIRAAVMGMQVMAAGDTFQCFAHSTSNAASATEELILQRVGF